ncbi:MAG: hypothetical protein U5K84_06765 [Alkalibacterium sp.]|nr:hypothetical protein [Alkalibacterium sp.]
MKVRSKEETAGLLAEKCAEKFQTTIGLSALADLSLNPANQLLSGTGYVAVTRKGEAARVKKVSLPEKPEPVLREIIKNEALALLKDGHGIVLLYL